MKPKELIEKLQEFPSDLDIAIVEGVTNNHIYNFYSGWTHISGDENYFELSFDLDFKTILRWFKMKIYFKFWDLKYKKKFNECINSIDKGYCQNGNFKRTEK